MNPYSRSEKLSVADDTQNNRYTQTRTRK